MPSRDDSIAAYDFDLPPALVAQHPLPQRDASRLLVLERSSGRLSHGRFAQLPDLLRPGDLLVLNRSRVFPARLLGRRPGGGAAEVLLLRRREADLWEAMLRPARRLRPGVELTIAPEFSVRVERDASAASAGRLVRLLSRSGEPCSTLVERHGHVPLPPYIRRPDAPADRERYQTVFARESGSVAAPTAGLHFTPELLARLAARKIETAELVLHVGPGTFRPVEVDEVRQHRVDPERFSLPEQTVARLRRARAEGRRVVAVGTTTTRTLESRAGSGADLEPGEGETDLVITPGFPFRVVDALLTNFHLPRSSLLLLVSAFAGRERILASYREAIEAGYRFYSYGDAMLIE